MTRRSILLIVTCIFLAGCNLSQGTRPQAWIDAPLDGSSLLLAPYTIVFHAFAAGNPQAVELTINSQAVTPDASNWTSRWLRYLTCGARRNRDAISSLPELKTKKVPGARLIPMW